MGKKQKVKPVESSDEEDEMDFDPRELEIAEEFMRSQQGLTALDSDEEDEGDEGEGSEGEGEEDEEDSEGEGEVPESKEEKKQQKKFKMPKPEYKNNKVALTAKLQEIQTPKDWPWIERLDITSQPLELEDVNNDLEREKTFYARTLHAMNQGIVQLKHLNIPFQRPSDFFAEMVKPDSQMDRIKDALITEKKRIDISMERRQRVANQKYSKEVQVAKTQEKQKAKRAAADQLKQLKKGTKHNEVRVRSSSKGAPSEDDAKQAKEKGAKRKAKDAKYGFGGKKKYAKVNTAESANDMSGFSSNKNRKSFKGFDGSNKGSGSKKGFGGFRGKAGTAKGANRPGKSRRNSSK